MPAATFRFYAELNDLLPGSISNQPIPQSFHGNQSVKHLIEALGIPHTEVAQILVNGEPQEFGYLVQDGDLIEVHPISTASDRLPIADHRRDEPERRFILDNHLGKLAAYLRMLGFDAWYRNDYQDDTLAELASQTNRILLTRDRRLLMRREIIYGYCVRSLMPEEQLREVIRRFDLANEIAPFHRCLRCNTPLREVSKARVLERLEPLTKRYYDEFHICPACEQIYWKGSHYDRMQRLVKRVTGSAG